MIADTRTCFDHFMRAHPNLEVLRLVKVFCDVTLATVQGWQAGEPLPGGDKLIRIRTLLHIAGYDVAELVQLNGDLRRIALLIGTQQVTPQQVASEVFDHKRDSLSGVWHILSQGGGIAPKRRPIVSQFVTEREAVLEAAIDEWRDKLEAAVASYPPPMPQGSNEPAVLPATFDPVLPAAFASAVALTTSLGNLLLNAGANQDARDATRGGQDMAELVEALRRLSD
jgi:hypothetical protein